MCLCPCSAISVSNERLCSSENAAPHVQNKASVVRVRSKDSICPASFHRWRVPFYNDVTLIYDTYDSTTTDCSNASYVTAPLLHHWTSTQISSFGFQSNPVLTCPNQQIRKCLNHPSQSKWNLNWIWPIHSNWCIWLGYWSNCKWIIRVHVKGPL